MDEPKPEAPGEEEEIVLKTLPPPAVFQLKYKTVPSAGEADPTKGEKSIPVIAMVEGHQAVCSAMEQITDLEAKNNAQGQTLAALLPEGDPERVENDIRKQLLAELFWRGEVALDFFGEPPKYNPVLIEELFVAIRNELGIKVPPPLPPRASQPKMKAVRPSQSLPAIQASPAAAGEPAQAAQPASPGSPGDDDVK